MEELERNVSEWEVSLDAWPEVDLACLEGRLARGVAVADSELELRLAIGDSAVERIWTGEREALVEAFGERDTFSDASWDRFITAGGVVAEMSASPVSELEDLRRNHWRPIHSNLPEELAVTDTARSAVAKRNPFLELE